MIQSNLKSQITVQTNSFLVDTMDKSLTSADLIKASSHFVAKENALIWFFCKINVTQKHIAALGKKSLRLKTTALISKHLFLC